MFGDVFDILFGCWHKRYSFPITAKKGSNPHCEAEQITGTYVVCLDCGKEFPYDWKQMKVMSGRSRTTEPAPIASGARAGFVKAA
jgi:hypothetical protein